MKRHLVALCTLVIVLVQSAAQPLVMPRFLKAGDRIAIISPSSTPEAATVEAGCQTLREWGYEPVVAPNALKNYHGFAGTAEERTADLLWALRDSSVSAIMCSRGGDGAVQVLQRVPLKEFRRHPKWLIGFSDVTALHSALVSAGVMSIHGSMCHAISSMEGRDTVSLVLRRLLAGELPCYEVEHHDLDQFGEATGMLVGGNLSVFCGLAGSDYDFLNRGNLILFVEDTDEAMTKVDRMFHLLEIRGVMKRVRGVIVGKFSSYKHPQNGFADMYDMLHEYLQHYKIPVCYSFPVGHARLNNFPMIEGSRVRLSVGTEGTRLEFLETVN